MTAAENFSRDGYFVADFGEAARLALIRRLFLRLFALAAGTEPRSVESFSDRDVVRLYKSDHRSRWVGAYDQLRYLPEIYGLAADYGMCGLLCGAGIAQAVIGAKLVVRADMPDDEKWDFPPHQDYPFNRGSLNSVTVWVPFQDTPDDMGPLYVIPSSHRHGEHPQKEGLLTPSPADDLYRAVPIKLGQVLIFSQFLIHKSGRNISDKIRFSLQVRFNELAHSNH
jgi:ectoine hydroxylase-related dioxygenase (phytanoyl-CoA dioxygenase family)